MGLGKGGFKLSDLIISMCLFYQNEGEVLLGRVAVLSMRGLVVYPAYNSSRPLDKSMHILFVYLHVSPGISGLRGTYSWNKERPYHISPSIACTLNSSLLLSHLSHLSLQLQK
jgi:hypothetical protein